MQSVNIFSVDKPEGRLDVAQALGSSALMMFVYDLDPGGSSSPYHYEYEEEWLLVVEGTLVLAPGGTREVAFSTNSQLNASTRTADGGSWLSLSLEGTGSFRFSSSTAMIPAVRNMATWASDA